MSFKSRNKGGKCFIFKLNTNSSGSSSFFIHIFSSSISTGSFFAFEFDIMHGIIIISGGCNAIYFCESEKDLSVCCSYFWKLLWR